MNNDSWRLDGQVAIITGADRGLGRGVALELAGAGATVVLAARTASELDAVVAEITAMPRAADTAEPRALVVVTDVSEEPQIEALVASAGELGELRVLVTAAGMNRTGAAVRYPTADWDRLFHLLRATFLACRAFGAVLLNRGTRGSIVTMPRRWARSAIPVGSPTARPRMPSMA